MWAADRGNVSAVERLLEAGADVDAQNRQGMTALMKAVRRGRTHIVKILLERGSDRDLGDYTGRHAWIWRGTAATCRIIRLLK